MRAGGGASDPRLSHAADLSLPGVKEGTEGGVLLRDVRRLGRGVRDVWGFRVDVG